MPEVKEIPVDKIRPNPFQPREEFDKEKIGELADSIEQEDLVQPILVREKGETYQIIAGERRWRAFQFLEWKNIPAIVREATDIEARELSIAENWHRLDLEPQQAETFLARLYKDGKEKGRYENISDMAEKTGIPRGTLEDFLTAHQDRVEQEIGVDATYSDIMRTIPLREEPELRKEVLEKRVKGEIRATDLREFSNRVKKSSPPVRKALLEGTISPEEAETIEAELSTQEEKERATRSIERDRSSERVEFAVDVTKRREERKDLEAEFVERATGDIWKCPICEEKFRLIHVDPEGKHKFEEIED